MMEFLLYLTPTGQQIISTIMQRNYNIKQNAANCRNKEIFGIVKTPNFVICLNNIKNTISDKLDCIDWQIPINLKKYKELYSVYQIVLEHHYRKM